MKLRTYLFLMAFALSVGVTLFSDAIATTPVINGTAPRRLQPSFPRVANHTIAVPGDSFTLNYSKGVMPFGFYPEILANQLRGLGCAVKARNFGVSGDKTPQILARAEALTRYDTPDIGIVYGGANDVGTYTTAATQLHLQALIKCLKFGAINAVTNPAALPSGKIPGTRYVVMLDDSSTGGVAAYGSLKTTITGAGGSVQSVWEARNNNGGVTGWGRVAVAATAPTHTSKIVVVGMHLLNFTPGGETPSSQLAAWDSSTGLRSAQIAAATAENVGGAAVVYSDTYAFMGALITSGQETQNSASWHFADGDTHLNLLGEQYIAQSILATIQAQSGWIDALKR